MKAIIKKHTPGNHTAEQVLSHGATVYQGNVGEVRQELRNLRKLAAQKYECTSTDETKSDFISYEMSKYRAFKFDGEIWTEIYI